MITQSINLNLISGQVLPRVNASQYDSNTRTLNMNLYNGELAFNVPSGVSGYIQGTKPDRTGFQYSATVTEGSNVVTFDITEQMTAVSGEVTCELVLVDGDGRIATVNFILYVEPAALADDTVISETELPLIEQVAELAQNIDGYIAQMDADAAKSEAFGAGTVDGVPVTSDNPAYHNNAMYYAGEAAAAASGVEQYAEDSEAYAVGTRNGTPVASDDPTYRNNSKFYANAASGSASTAVASETAAAQSEENAEAWAVGEREGVPVISGDVTYNNNAKYYAGEAADSASNASTSETNAGLSESASAQSKEDSEAWANGTRNGTPVASDDPAYHNNAKYWADTASGTVNDMVGATASADGAHGLVPQPLMGDQDKFLGGDGTWKDVPAELSGLTDVSLGTLANGDVLNYNSTSQKWENAALGTAASKDSTNAVTQNSTDLVESGAVYTELIGKAPTSHASSSDTYGLGTTANYGHNKIIDNLTKTALTDGESLSAHMGNSLGKMIAPVQANLTAIQKYEIGEQFSYNGVLYEATALISSGGTITIGGNCNTAEDITTQISNFANKIAFATGTFSLVSGVAIADIDYPSGFNVSNCMVLTAELEFTSQEKYYTYPANEIFRYLSLTTTKIRVSTKSEYVGLAVRVALIKLA